MSVEFVAYTEAAVPAVREFNQRLLGGGAAADQQFPETPDPGWMPGMELFLAVEGSMVRGGYILRRQSFSAGGATVTAAHYRLPLSEGIVNRAYAMLGLRMVRDALRREPRLYALGMGGWEQPLPQMLKRLGWGMSAVPFYFKVVHPGRFLRHIQALRTSAVRRVALDAAACSGAGWLGMKVLGLARRLPVCPVDLADGFGPWADEVWERSCPAYGLTAQRDAATLERLYPGSDARFLKRCEELRPQAGVGKLKHAPPMQANELPLSSQLLRVRAAGGWAVLLDTQMQGHKQFGDMRVGTIVDCLAPPESAGAVVRAGTSVLEQRGVDLIVSNQMHEAWGWALGESGFRKGPSNFLLALSPALAQAAAVDRLKPAPPFHFNRGDGDGPIHL
jgi:hypothetical protein